MPVGYASRLGHDRHGRQSNGAAGKQPLYMQVAYERHGRLTNDAAVCRCSATSLARDAVPACRAAACPPLRNVNQPGFS